MKKALALLLALVMAFSLVACAQTPPADDATPPADNPPADTPPAEEGYTFGAVMQSLSAPIWIELMEHGDKCAAEYNSTVDWKSAEGSLENQIALIEAFIEQGVDVILIDPIDKEALIPVIQQALEAGIGFVTMGNLVEGGIDADTYNVCTTYPDARDSAAMTDLLIKMGGPGTYVMVNGSTGNFVSDVRGDAFKAACEAAGVKCEVQDGNWDPTTVTKVTEDMVTAAGADLKGLYNMDDSCLGYSMGVTMPEGTVLAGHNGEESVYTAIEEGKVAVTTLIGGAHIGYWNILTACKIAAGEEVPHQVYLKTYLVMNEDTKAEYWDPELAAKYPSLEVLTPAEARVVAMEPAEMVTAEQIGLA